MAVEDKVKQIIVEQLQVDEAEVTPGASFQEDLGADIGNGKGRQEQHNTHTAYRPPHPTALFIDDQVEHATEHAKSEYFEVFALSSHRHTYKERKHLGLYSLGRCGVALRDCIHHAQPQRADDYADHAYDEATT